MKSFQSQTRNWLIAVAVLLSASTFFYLYQHVRMAQVEESWDIFTSKINEFQKTQQEIKRYQKIAKQLGESHSRLVLRQESTAIKTTFSGNELYQAPALLKNTYEGDWVFQNEHFMLRTVEAASDRRVNGTKEVKQPSSLEMVISGSKTFLFLPDK